MQPTIKSRSGRELVLNTPGEDAIITAAARSDPEAQPLTDEQLAHLRPMRGRPRVEVKRPMVSMRMDPDLLEKLRALGPGWQTRVNAALRRLVEQGSV